MIEYNGIELNEKLIPIVDSKMLNLRTNWYENRHHEYNKDSFITIAEKWFKSSSLNEISGWDKFPYIDVIIGCTNYIESFVIKYGWDNFQVLPDEYSYYSLMGKQYTWPGQLVPNKPLILSLPNFKYGDIRPEWDDLLKECLEKNIDIHIDFAWMTVAKNIYIDVGHPCIKSFAMSLSKYNMQWNRIGLRWTRQRTMDSITIMNHYYEDVNSGLMNCGLYVMKNLPRDYIWNTYGDQYDNLCETYGLIKTKLAHAVGIPNDNYLKGISHLIELK